MTRRLTMCLLGLASLLSRDAAGQSSVAKGAVIGGVAGGIGAGLLGAAMSQALCDAADCGGSWVEGAVPGAVIGGLGGALLGAGFGALFPASDRGERRTPTRPAVIVMVEGSAARLEANLIEQSATGFRGMVGLQVGGGLVVGPAIERLSGGGWRVINAVVAARLDPDRGVVRPFAELDVGRFDWRNPAILFSCDPTSPTCVPSPGTQTDDYLGVAGAVGVSAGPEAGGWRAFAMVRFHHAGGRPAGEPVSTLSRQIRQIAVGANVAFRIR